MNKGISRLRTRISIVLMVLCVVCLALGMVREGWLTMILAVALFFGAMLVRPWKCPTCRKTVSNLPQWSEPGKYHCPYCGSRLAYDDETEES